MMRNGKTNFLGSKKGLGNSVIGVVVFLVIFSFLTILAYLIYSNIIDAFIVSGLWNGQIEITGLKFLGALHYFDGITVLITIALIVGVGVGMYKITAPPVFFVVQFIMAAVYGYVSYFFNFIFAQMVSSAQFTTVTVFYPKMLLVCNNLHWVALVNLLVGILALYGKRQESGGEFLG